MTKGGRFRADWAHENHPDLDARMRLAAHFLIALELRMGSGGAIDLRRAVEAARYTAKSEWEDALRLDAYLAKVSTAASEAAVHVNVGKASAAAVARLQTIVAGIECTVCAGRAKGVVCNRGLGDDRNLAAGAACLDLIFQLFDAMVALAESVYSPFLAPGDDLAVTLKTRVAGRPLLDGETLFPEADGPALRSALVVIDFPDEVFDEHHLGALPYVMLHEIFVHAPESARAVGRRVPSNSQCALREGFMDRAAFSLLEAWLAMPANLPSAYRHVVDDFVLEAGAAHDGRYRPTGSSGGQEGVAWEERGVRSARKHGRAAFDQLARFYGQSKALAFAARLNLLQFSDIQKSNLLILLRHGGAALNGGPVAAGRASVWLDKLGLLRDALEGAADAAVLAVIDDAVDKNDF